MRHLSGGCWWWLSVQQGGWPLRKYPCFISGTCTLLGDVITFYLKLPDMCRNQLHFSKPICLLMLCNTNFRFYNWGYCFTNFYSNSACCGTLRGPPCNVQNIITHSICFLLYFLLFKLGHLPTSKVIVSVPIWIVTAINLFFGFLLVFPNLGYSTSKGIGIRSYRVSTKSL